MLPTKPNTAGGTSVGKTMLRPHPPGQNRIGPHPNEGNAKTGIRTSNPTGTGFNSRVGRKAF